MHEELMDDFNPHLGCRVHLTYLNATTIYFVHYWPNHWVCAICIFFHPYFLMSAAHGINILLYFALYIVKNCLFDCVLLLKLAWSESEMLEQPFFIWYCITERDAIVIWSKEYMLSHCYINIALPVPTHSNEASAWDVTPISSFLQSFLKAIRWAEHWIAIECRIKNLSILITLGQFFKCFGTSFLPQEVKSDHPD